MNEEGTNQPRFQAVTKFQAHAKYLTRCLLSPDIKYSHFGFISVSSIHLRVPGTWPLVRLTQQSRSGRSVPTMSFITRKLCKAISAGYGIALSAQTQRILLLVRSNSSLSIPTPMLTKYKASSDHTARLWDMATGVTVRQYNGHHKGMHFLRWGSPFLNCAQRPCVVHYMMEQGE